MSVEDRLTILEEAVGSFKEKQKALEDRIARALYIRHASMYYNKKLLRKIQRYNKWLYERVLKIVKYTDFDTEYTYKEKYEKVVKQIEKLKLDYE